MTQNVQGLTKYLNAYLYVCYAGGVSEKHIALSKTPFTSARLGGTRLGNLAKARLSITHDIQGVPCIALRCFQSSQALN